MAISDTTSLKYLLELKPVQATKEDLLNICIKTYILKDRNI